VAAFLGCFVKGFFNIFDKFRHKKALATRQPGLKLSIRAGLMA
jgi:hypothetical protein